MTVLPTAGYQLYPGGTAKIVLRDTSVLSSFQAKRKTIVETGHRKDRKGEGTINDGNEHGDWKIVRPAREKTMRTRGANAASWCGRAAVYAELEWMRSTAVHYRIARPAQVRPQWIGEGTISRTRLNLPLAGACPAGPQDPRLRRMLGSCRRECCHSAAPPPPLLGGGK